MRVYVRILRRQNPFKNRIKFFQLSQEEANSFTRIFYYRHPLSGSHPEFFSLRNSHASARIGELIQGRASCRVQAEPTAKFRITALEEKIFFFSLSPLLSSLQNTKKKSPRKKALFFADFLRLRSEESRQRATRDVFRGRSIFEKSLQQLFQLWIYVSPLKDENLPFVFLFFCSSSIEKKSDCYIT